MEIWKSLVISLVISLVMSLVILVVLLGNANKLGNKEANQYVVKDRFAILTGTVTQDDYTISYPAGFNKDNSTVISCMLQHKTSENLTWGTGECFSSAGYVSGALPTRIALKPTGILIDIRNIVLQNETLPIVYDNINTSGKFNYKLILMRID